MFDFLKKLFPFLVKKLDLTQVDAIRKTLEEELKSIPEKAGAATLRIKIPAQVSEELANVLLEQLAKEYGDKLKKRLVLVAQK